MFDRLSHFEFYILEEGKEDMTDLDKYFENWEFNTEVVKGVHLQKIDFQLKGRERSIYGTEFLVFKIYHPARVVSKSGAILWQEIALIRMN